MTKSLNEWYEDNILRNQGQQEVPNQEPPVVVTTKEEPPQQEEKPNDSNFSKFCFLAKSLSEAVAKLNELTDPFGREEEMTNFLLEQIKDLTKKIDEI